MMEVKGGRNPHLFPLGRLALEERTKRGRGRRRWWRTRSRRSKRRRKRGGRRKRKRRTSREEWRGIQE